MSDNADITVKNITLPGAEWGRMENQLAAAERLYQAIQPVWWGNGLLREEKQLEQALADYANAKGE